MRQGLCRSQPHIPPGGTGVASLLNSGRAELTASTRRAREEPTTQPAATCGRRSRLTNCNSARISGILRRAFFGFLFDVTAALHLDYAFLHRADIILC